MKKAEHMMDSMTMSKLINYQNEYTSLVKLPNPTNDNLDRIGLLEIIFTKLDQGKILIRSAA
jgi:hypothetical protein